jgi:hypothetical protein
MNVMLAKLAGKKTYLIAFALVVYEVAGYLLGQTDAIDMHVVLEGLGLAALRAGIAKAAGS